MVSCFLLNTNSWKAIFIKEIHWILMIDRTIEVLLREQLRISTIQLRDIIQIKII